MASERASVPAARILEQMADAVVFADLEGRIRLWNPAAEALFGFTAAEAVGQRLDLIIPESLRKAHWEGFDRAIRSGGVIGAVAIGRDATARYEEEKAMRRRLSEIG